MVPEFIHILCHTFSLPVMIYDQNLLFGQKFIFYLDRNVLICYSRMHTPKQNLMRNSIFVISTSNLEHNLG